MTADLVVRDVRAVLPDGVMHADVEVVDGRIAGIVPAGEAGAARSTLDGGGREAYPGLVDPHVHFRGDESAAPGDSFADMAECAARGGVTSLIAFVTAPPDAVGVDAVRPVLDAAVDVPVDFGLHHVLWPRTANLEGVAGLVEAGISSFKMFLAYPERGFMFDGDLAPEALDAVARAGGVMLVHCEDGHTIRWLDAAGRRKLGRSADILDYLAARPDDLEAVSVAQVGLWAAATGCPLHIVHLSTAPGFEAAKALRARGHDISLETCPQYLELDSGDLARLGALAKFAPVLRPPEHRAAIWSALQGGEVTIVGTDHSGHAGDTKRRIGDERGIFDVPFGMPGLETLLPVLYTAGVVSGRLTRSQLAGVLSANAARRFGWYPWKGAIRVGSSADLTLVDPDEERTVAAGNLHSNAGYSPFEGRSLRGWPSATILRGEVVYESGEIQAAPGRFLPTTPGAQRAPVPVEAA